MASMRRQESAMTTPSQTCDSGTGLSSPIFIVGPSRSGTTLMRSMLNNHSEIHLAGETHYFDDLRTHCAGTLGLYLDDRARVLCEDYFLALSHRPYGRAGSPDRGWLDRHELRALAAQLGHMPDAYFESFCRLSAERAGKTRWGEKTPRHIFRIAEIFDRYPRANIICMVRDPRAAITSYCEWANRADAARFVDPAYRHEVSLDRRRARLSYNILLASLLWRAAVQAMLDAVIQFTDDRVRIQRYEVLVNNPVTTCREICRWLKVEYESGMIDVPIHNSSFTRVDPHGGVSRASLERWRSRMSRSDVGIVQFCCSSTMRATGYRMEPVGTPVCYLVGQWLLLPLVIARALIANRARFARITGYLWRRVKPVLGVRSVVMGSLER